MNALPRWPAIDVAKGIAIVMLAFGIATLWLVADPHFEGFGGAYRATTSSRFVARLLTSVTPPTFFVLSGAVVGKRFGDLAGSDATSAWAQHLFARGIFLVLIELLITQLYNASHPQPHYVLIVEVLSAFGFSFVVLAVAHRLPNAAWVAIAAGLWLAPELAGEGLSSWFGATPGDDGPREFLVALVWTVADRPSWQVEYPVASWLPFIAIGMAVGRARASAAFPSTRQWLAAAALAITAFVVLRATTTWGALGQAAPQTWMQFLSPTKYPVSLHYAAFGLGGASLVLAVGTWLSTRTGWLVAALKSLGKQPLAAFALIKVVVALVQVTTDFRARDGSLLGATVVAGVIVVVMVPLLRRYDTLKRSYRDRFVALRLL